MKKSIYASIVIATLLALAACNSSTGTSGTTASATSLSTEGQLLVGTLKLEGTDLAVTADQAKQLLPLWETLQSLASSNTAASEEINAVIDQIKGTMSTKQLAGITAMKLTESDLAAEMAAAGSATSASGATSVASGSSAQPQAGTDTGAPAGGGPGGGTPPTDLGGGISASTGSMTGSLVQASATQSASSQLAATTSQVSPALLDTIVELLEKKIG